MRAPTDHPTVIFHETMNLREIANIYVGQNGIIVGQASTRIENVCEQAIHIAIHVRIFIEKSAIKNSIKLGWTKAAKIPQFSFIFKQTISLRHWQLTHWTPTNRFRSVDFDDCFGHIFADRIRCIVVRIVYQDSDSIRKYRGYGVLLQQRFQCNTQSGCRPKVIWIAAGKHTKKQNNCDSRPPTKFSFLQHSLDFIIQIECAAAAVVRQSWIEDRFTRRNTAFPSTFYQKFIARLDQRRHHFRWTQSIRNKYLVQCIQLISIVWNFAGETGRLTYELQKLLFAEIWWQHSENG